MSDEEKAVEATATEEQLAVTDESAETEAPAEAETTETVEAKPEHAIPKSRFDQVISERNDLREQKEELVSRIEALEEGSKPAPAEEPAPASDGPPEHLSQREKVEWYVRHDAKKMLEEELGMDIATVRTLLGTTKETSTDYADRRWQALCTQHKMDPANQELQEYAYNYAKAQGSGADINKIMASAAKLFGGGGNGVQAKSNDPSATIEETGVTGVMTGDRVTFRNAKDATEAAGKGIVATRESLSEILERSMAERKKA